jgi:hypothetical protein
MNRYCAIFKAGPGRNRSKPRPRTSAENSAIYRDKRKMRVSSVFDLATPHRQRLSKNFRSYCLSGSGSGDSSDPRSLGSESGIG